MKPPPTSKTTKKSPKRSKSQTNGATEKAPHRSSQSGVVPPSSRSNSASPVGNFKPFRSNRSKSPKVTPGTVKPVRVTLKLPQTMPKSGTIKVSVKGHVRLSKTYLRLLLNNELSYILPYVHQVGRRHTVKIPDGLQPGATFSAICDQSNYIQPTESPTDTSSTHRVSPKAISSDTDSSRTRIQPPPTPPPPPRRVDGIQKAAVSSKSTPNSVSDAGATSGKIGRQPKKSPTTSALDEERGLLLRTDFELINVLLDINMVRHCRNSVQSRLTPIIIVDVLVFDLHMQVKRETWCDLDAAEGQPNTTK